MSSEEKLVIRKLKSLGVDYRLFPNQYQTVKEMEKLVKELEEMCGIQAMRK